MAAPDPAPDAGSRDAFDAADLVRHGRFVKSLARELARDDDEADELAARAMAEAVARRPETGAGLRAWLRTVLSRLAIRSRRDDERRGRRERAAFEATGGASRVARATVDVVARIELEHAIAAAFATLEEPYQRTLFLRFFDDRTPAWIAHEDGVPVETVKTRLKRGLARLRARLDASRRGARGSWRATALALARDGAPLLGITKAKGAAAAAAVFVVASAVTWWRVERRARTVDATILASVPPESATPPRSDERAPPPAEPDAAAAARESSATRRAEEPPLPFVSGVVVDEHGTPLAGVRVVASFVQDLPSRAALMAGLRATTSPHVATTLDFARVEADTLARTDRDGRFSVGAPPDLLAGLYFVAAGRAPASCFDLSALAPENQQRRITLVPGCTVRGRIVDTEGRPIPGAAISANEEEPPRVTRLHPARPLVSEDTAPRFGALADQWSTDADGRFELLLPRRSFRLDATAEGYVGDLDYSEGVDGEFDFTLRRQFALLEVVDARTHAPVAAVRGLAVREDEPQRSDCLFPPEGAPTAIGRLFAHAPSHLVLFARGYHARTLDLAADPDGEPPQLTVPLEPGLDAPSIAGAVRGARAAEVALRWMPPPPRGEIEKATAVPVAAQAAVFAAERPDASDRRQRLLATATVDADGRFAFAGIPPGTYCLDVVAPGCTPRRRIVTAPATALEFDLAASAQLEVLVVDAAGAPCAGAQVHVQAERDAHAWSRTTGADGVATFAWLPDADLRLVAARELHDRYADDVTLLEASAFSLRNDVTLVAGERRRVQLTVLDPVPVTLHVHDLDGRSIEGANIAVALNQARAPDELLRATVRDLAGRVFETDVDGEAQLELWPSVWNFEVWANGHHFHVLYAIEATLKRPIELPLAD